jgi:hypothetical protein
MHCSELNPTFHFLLNDWSRNSDHDVQDGLKFLLHQFTAGTASLTQSLNDRTEKRHMFSFSIVALAVATIG